MLKIANISKQWREAGALNADVNLLGFADERTTLAKDGKVIQVLRVPGIDYESQDGASQQQQVHRLEAAQKAFGSGFHVYQYLFKTNRPEIPFANYGDPVVDAAIEQRREFFEAKRDSLYRMEIFYVIVLEGAKAKQGLLSALKSGSFDQIRSQVSSRGMRVLLRSEIEANAAKLDQKVRAFIHHLSDVLRIEVLGQQEAFTFFRRLLNFDDWRIAGRPKATQFLDYQVVNSDVEAERDHLRVGDHYVRVLTMTEVISETRPMVLNDLLKIPANFYAVLEWSPMSVGKARKDVTAKRRHFNMAKKSMIQSMREERTRERDEMIDESKQADIESLGECLRAIGEGQGMGGLSVTVVPYGRDLGDLNRSVSEFVSVFSNADGVLFPETYNQLNALFAVFPGNSVHNLRKLPILNSNHADLSFLFTVHAGETRNEHLGAEYLAVLETDNDTPYFLNLHDGEVAHTFICGTPGSGKSVMLNFIASNAQKYRPQTYIFDIGGSFRSLTEIYGGSYMDVGQKSSSFTINPFSLEPTTANLEFLFSFFEVLIEGDDQHARLTQQEKRQLWLAIERTYTAPVDRRTTSTLSSLVGDPDLKLRLARWTGKGQYGFLFDNAADTLTFSNFQTFNFAGWGESPDALEPLLFYVLHRSAMRITGAADLATFKMFLIDEAWHFLKNETIREYIISAQKTWRKHNAAMILATQSIKELRDSEMLDAIAESCPTKIFLANPGMDRSVYAQAFHLNDTELDLIADLVPPGEMLIRNSKGSKKVRLELDSVFYWISTNNSRDNLRKRDYFERFGITDGIRRLAQDFPRNPSSSIVPTDSRTPTLTAR